LSIHQLIEGETMAPEITTTIVGLLLVITGIAATIAILEGIGRVGPDAAKIARLKLIHRALAIIFLILFVIIFVGMHGRLKYWHGEPASRIVFHWVLGLAVLALLAAKIFIFNRYKKMAAHLPVMGWFLLLSTFILFSLSGGFTVLRTIGPDRPGTAANYTNALVDQKCGHCHSLERVYKFEGDKQDTLKLVNRMRDYSPGWISDSEAETIAESIFESSSNTDE
jgi:hypothetical protein